MSRSKIARLNQEDIIRLGTRKPSFSIKDKMIALLKKNPNKWYNKQDIMRDVNCTLNGVSANIVNTLAYEMIFDVLNCKCGCKHSIYRWHKLNRRSID